jgi:hypothetical protein
MFKANKKRTVSFQTYHRTTASTAPGTFCKSSSLIAANWGGYVQ